MGRRDGMSPQGIRRNIQTSKRKGSEGKRWAEGLGLDHPVNAWSAVRAAGRKDQCDGKGDLRSKGGGEHSILWGGWRDDILLGWAAEGKSPGGKRGRWTWCHRFKGDGLSVRDAQGGGGIHGKKQNLGRKRCG